MYAQDLTAQLTSNSILDAAYAWVCAARINTSHNNSIWDLRFTWDALKPQLIQALCNNEYHLSPPISAWFLKDLDTALESNPNTYYVRYMDDWLVLTKTRNHLRQAIKKINQILAVLKLSAIHPDKTFIGWIKAGFDFLGYYLNPETIELSKTTIKRCQAKAVQLYEQGAFKKSLEQYWRWYVRWAKVGLTGCYIDDKLLGNHRAVLCSVFVERAAHNNRWLAHNAQMQIAASRET